MLLHLLYNIKKHVFREPQNRDRVTFAGLFLFGCEIFF